MENRSNQTALNEEYCHLCIRYFLKSFFPKIENKRILDEHIPIDPQFRDRFIIKSDATVYLLAIYKILADKKVLTPGKESQKAFVNALNYQINGDNFDINWIDSSFSFLLFREKFGDIKEQINILKQLINETDNEIDVE